jgi:hypothetical protein
VSDETMNLVVEHYGKKGMQWGVRKGRNTRDTSRTVFKKAPKKLTSAELEKRIKRMESEKKYNDLNKRDIGKGQQLAADIITKSGKTLATTVLTGALILGVKLAIQKKFGSEAASAITKRGKS